ncbi:AsmA family protein [Caenimonas terrae]|uniref:AsmA family protein n=1 Tax=Caenimonas terrae TaxID=696074 RepID=A0ABW0NBM6_9BURK
MSRWIRIVSLLFGLAVLLLLAVVLSLQYWVGTGDFRGRIEREASLALGLPVRLRAVAVDIFPLPSVALDGLSIGSQPPVTLERIEARPVWAALLRGRLQVATLVVRDAVIPGRGVAAVAAAMMKRAPGAAAPGPAASAPGQPWWPRRARFDRLSWTDARGSTTTVDAQLSMDEDGLPSTASVKVLRGRVAGATADLTRKGTAWLLKAGVGGGTVDGTLALQAAGGRPAGTLQGNFRIANVELAALTAPSRTLAGRLDGSTTLRAPLQDLGRLGETLQTQSQFTVRNAVVHGIDLRQAVRTVGLNRGGDTPLDMLAGRLATQGGAMQLTELVASAGNLSATGQVAMATDKSLSGTVDVSLAGAAAGNALSVPLQVGGTLDNPSVTLSRGALIGAAIGTAVMPGVGTGAGAKLGDRLGRSLRGLFGK